MFHKIISTLFGNSRRRRRARRRRRSRVSPIAAEVQLLEERILLAGTVFWTDSAAGDHDFGTKENWNPEEVPVAANPFPNTPDTGVFENIAAVVDVTDMRVVGTLKFNGGTNVDMNFTDGTQMHVAQLNIGKMRFQVQDTAVLTINSSFADGETSFIAGGIGIGIAGYVGKRAFPTALSHQAV